MSGYDEIASAINKVEIDLEILRSLVSDLKKETAGVVSYELQILEDLANRLEPDAARVRADALALLGQTRNVFTITPDDMEIVRG